MGKININITDVRYFTFSGRIPKEFENVWGVYVVVGKNKEILYVGMSTNLKSRASQYVSKKDKEYIVLIPIDKKFIYRLENSLISKFRPKYNRVGNPNSRDEKGNHINDGKIGNYYR